jgi:hypothetical protein
LSKQAAKIKISRKLNSVRMLLFSRKKWKKELKHFQLLDYPNPDLQKPVNLPIAHFGNLS